MLSVVLCLGFHGKGKLQILLDSLNSLNSIELIVECLARISERGFQRLYLTFRFTTK